MLPSLPTRPAGSSLQAGPSGCLLGHTWAGTAALAKGLLV